MIKNKIIKISIFCITIFSIIFVVGIISIYYFGIYKSEKDLCLDTGICKKGTVVNTAFGIIEINEQTCMQYGWKWDKDTEYCFMK